MKELLSKVWLFLAGSLWMVAAVMFTVAPEFTQTNLAIAAAAALFTLASGWLFRRPLRETIKAPYTRKAASSALSVFLVACILGMVNYLAVKTSKTVDLTASKLHTLSAQSLDIAGKIQNETSITLFAKRVEWEIYLPLLRQYENVNRKIKLRAIDVEENPSLAKLNKIERSGTIVVESGDKKLKGVASSELAITNLLIKTLREKRLVVYYTSGHGEFGPGETEGSFLFEAMTDEGYELREFDSLAAAKVPVDADALLMLGPKNGLLDLEVKKIQDYLSRGGNLFVLLGPNFEKANFSNLQNLLASRGIRHHNALALDRLSEVQGANATIPIVTNFNNEHPATKNFSGRVLFALSAALTPEEGDDTRFYALAKSSPFPGSWAESNLDDIDSGKVYFNKGLDMEGPVTLMAAAENTKDFGRLAVSASSEFVSNAYQNHSANFNLFMNTLAWLMGEEGIISLNRPSLSQNMILLSAPQISLIFYFSILFLPFAFFGLAFWVYRKRARK